MLPRQQYQIGERIILLSSKIPDISNGEYNTEPAIVSDNIPERGCIGITYDVGSRPEYRYPLEWIRHT